MLPQSVAVLSFYGERLLISVIPSLAGVVNIMCGKTFSIWTTSLKRFPADIRQLPLLSIVLVHCDPLDQQSCLMSAGNNFENGVHVLDSPTL